MPILLFIARNGKMGNFESLNVQCKRLQNVLKLFCLDVSVHRTITFNSYEMLSSKPCTSCIAQIDKAKIVSSIFTLNIEENTVGPKNMPQPFLMRVNFIIILFIIQLIFALFICVMHQVLGLKKPVH